MANSILTIDADVVAANWALLAERVAPSSCAATLKADAYGLGLTHVAPALWQAGCRHFFVSTLADGEQLRLILPQPATIYTLHGFNAGSVQALIASRITPVINTTRELREWEAAHRGTDTASAMQVDTGMARLGLSLAEYGKAVAARATDGDRTLVISHLVSAEVAAAPENEAQLQYFRQVRELLPSAKFSLANSAGVNLGREFHFDLLRVGAALFGAHFDNPSYSRVQLPVRLQARVLQIRELKAGDAVGYNHTWRCPRDGVRIAIISVGYAGGIPSSPSATRYLSINGRRAPIVGSVSMDLTTVDVSDLPADAVEEQMLVDIVSNADELRQYANESGIDEVQFLMRICQGHHERRYTAQASRPTVLAPDSSQAIAIG